MLDLFGNDDRQKTTVCKNLSTESEPPLPAIESAFKGDSLRKQFYKGDWYFSYLDVIALLADTTNPRRYAADLKRKLKAEGSEVFDRIVQLKIIAPDGKLRSTQCLSRTDIFRLMEAIPSPKAEPCKQWMASLADQFLKEEENPDLAIQRGYEGYLKKGYSPAFASRRAKSVIHRKALTETWKRHGITTPKDFAQLTDRESQGIFGKTTGEMKRDRDLEPSSSLRDEMTLSEITAQDVADTVIAALAEKEGAWGYSENAVQVDRGSEVGAKVLADLEKVLEA